MIERTDAHISIQMHIYDAEDWGSVKHEDIVKAVEKAMKELEKKKIPRSGCIEVLRNSCFGSSGLVPTDNPSDYEAI